MISEVVSAVSMLMGQKVYATLQTEVRVGYISGITDDQMICVNIVDSNGELERSDVLVNQDNIVVLRNTNFYNIQEFLDSFDFLYYQGTGIKFKVVGLDEHHKNIIWLSLLTDTGYPVTVDLPYKLQDLEFLILV